MIINKDVMRNFNERSVLQAIVNHGPLSRNAISKLLGLNKVTVSDIVGHFLERKLVKSIGEAQSQNTSGRKPELVEYNSSYGYVVNFTISGCQLEMLVTKFDGRTLEYHTADITHFSVTEIVSKIEQMIDQLPQFEVVKGLQAISIAIFGTVYNGEITISPFVDFEGFKLETYFQSKYQVPVIVENEANLAAIFEQDFSKQELQNIISIGIHEGIGAGIIINAQLYTGNYGRAGEIGGIISQNVAGDTRPVSQLPSFDVDWSQSALLTKAAKIMEKPDYALSDLVQDYENKNEAVLELMDHFCYHMAVVTRDLIAMYDPQMIFFNAPLIEQIPEVLKNIQMKLAFVPLIPPLVLSKDVKYATLLGGASMAIHRVLDMEGTRLIFHH